MIKKIIAQIIPKRVINKIKRIIFKKELKREIEKIHNKHGKCIIFISVPTHGNLGDQAIVYSQYKMFESLGFKNNIVEIRNNDYLRFPDVIEKLVNSKDIIVIDGGGNMGTLWIEEEYRIRDIIKRFKNNKIIIFPETVYYSNDDFGKEEFKKAKEIYSEHKNLHIFLRDRKSYDLLKYEYINAHIEYTPDIVLYLKGLPNEINREDALICIRNDKEKVLGEDVTREIEKIFKNKKIKTKYTSTISDNSVSKEIREKELYKKWSEFSKSKIVITDRLHGMIFAAITATPCVALNNSNGKVKGVYEWIKDLPYITFCDDFNKLNEAIEKVIYLNSNEYKNYYLINEFEPIIKVIENNK